MNSTVSLPSPPLIVTVPLPEVTLEMRKTCTSDIGSGYSTLVASGLKSWTSIVPGLEPGPTLRRSFFNGPGPESTPLIVTFGALIATGSRPAYEILVPSTVIAPECASDG